MKLSCTKDNLWQALAITSRLGAKQAHLPVLENVLIKAEGGNVKLIATNLEMAVSCSMRGRVEQEGEYTVPSKLFYDFANLLPSERVDIDLVDDGLMVSCKNSKTKLKGIASTEFPVVPSVSGQQTYSMSVSEFKKGLANVLFAASTNESRPELAGVFFSFHDEREGGGKVIMAATDSYRLSEVVLTISGGSTDSAQVIIPQRTLSELHRILGLFKDDVEAPEAIEIGVSENQVVFTYGSFELTSRTIEGVYPDYRQIIPEKSVTSFDVNRSELIQAIKTASLFSKLGLYDIRLSSKGENEIEIRSNDSVRGENVVSLDVEMEGGENEIALNYRYLLDGLNAMSSSKIKIQMIDGMNPCVVTPLGMPDEVFKYIVMPIRQ